MRRTTDPAKATPQEVFGLLTNLVVPRPIALVSTISAEGESNLAPFSFFTIVSVKPPCVCFCPTPKRDGTDKQTLKNAAAMGEFVVNFVDRAIVEAMNTTSVPADGMTKWESSGLTPIPSTCVAPARVAESPAHIECALHDIVRVGGSAIVIGRVLAIHVENEDYAPVSRLGGEAYLDLDGGKLFEMPRPNTGSGPSSLVEPES